LTVWKFESLKSRKVRIDFTQIMKIDSTKFLCQTDWRAPYFPKVYIFAIDQKLKSNTEHYPRFLKFNWKNIVLMEKNRCCIWLSVKVFASCSGLSFIRGIKISWDLRLRVYRQGRYIREKELASWFSVVQRSKRFGISLKQFNWIHLRSCSRTRWPNILIKTQGIHITSWKESAWVRTGSPMVNYISATILKKLDYPETFEKSADLFDITLKMDVKDWGLPVTIRKEFCKLKKHRKFKIICKPSLFNPY